MNDEKDRNPLPIGTQLSGYITGFTRPGEGSGCWNCIWLDESQEKMGGTTYHCDHPTVKADFDVEHRSGKAIVSLTGCCAYIRRKGDK